MQWYVYVVTIFAAIFLSQVAAELVKRPALTILRIRRLAIVRLIAFSKTSLPRPREMAISSRDIREYDQAVRNTKDAQRTLRDLGIRLLWLSETEVAITTIMRLFGVNIEGAGQELIHLSELYKAAISDSEEQRREIARSVLRTCAALAAYRNRSHDGLVRFQVEPMDLILRPDYLGRLRLGSTEGMTPAV